MRTFTVRVLVLLLVAALERSTRRRTPQAPGLHGSENRDDRDWARIKLDLMALDDNRPWATSHHNGPRPA